MNDEKLFIAEYTPEATAQFLELASDNRIKIASAIEAFEKLGTKYKNINQLDFNLFETKRSQSLF